MNLLPDGGTMRRSGAVLVVLALLPACSMPSFLKVADPKDGVSVKNLTVDLAFGAESPQAPQNDRPGAADGLLTLTALLELFEEAEVVEEDPPFSRRPRPAIPDPECPEAADTSFPEKSASKFVQGRPTPGEYRWKQDGWIEVAPLPRIPLPPLTTRTIRAVTSTSEGFTYEYEQTSIGGKEVQTIEVRNAMVEESQTHPLSGVYLRRLQFYTRDVQTGQVSRTIDFNPPALLAPKLMSLPVVTEVVSAKSVDLANDLSFTLDGAVDATSRVRLDACGELIEAWKFTGTVRLVQSISDETHAIRSTKYDTYFAPQLGGLFVGDHVTTTGSLGIFQYTSSAATNIGTLEPTPEKTQAS